MEGCAGDKSKRTCQFRTDQGTWRVRQFKFKPFEGNGVASKMDKKEYLGWFSKEGFGPSHNPNR